VATGCQEDVTAFSCPYRNHAKSLASKVQQITSRAFYVSQVLQFMDGDCNPESYGWPFTQSCKKDKQCNYGYLLGISNTQYSKDINKVAANIFLGSWYAFSDCAAQCQVNYNKWNQYGFGSEGLWGYSASQSTLQRGDCPAICKYANQAGNIDLVAIRSYCIPNKYEKCKQEIKFNQLCGFDLSNPIGR